MPEKFSAVYLVYKLKLQKSLARKEMSRCNIFVGHDTFFYIILRNLK